MIAPTAPSGPLGAYPCMSGALSANSTIRFIPSFLLCSRPVVSGGFWPPPVFGSPLQNIYASPAGGILTQDELPWP